MWHAWNKPIYKIFTQRKHSNQISSWNEQTLFEINDNNAGGMHQRTSTTNFKIQSRLNRIDDRDNSTGLLTRQCDTHANTETNWHKWQHCVWTWDVKNNLLKRLDSEGFVNRCECHSSGSLLSCDVRAMWIFAFRLFSVFSLGLYLTFSLSKFAKSENTEWSKKVREFALFKNIPYSFHSITFFIFNSSVFRSCESTFFKKYYFLFLYRDAGIIKPIPKLRGTRRIGTLSSVSSIESKTSRRKTMSCLYGLQIVDH